VPSVARRGSGGTIVGSLPYRAGLPLDRRPNSGFTLLEILIVIALLGLLVGVFAVGSARLLQEEPGTPEEVFQKALDAARRYAVENYVEVRLSFDTDAKAFSLKATTPGSAESQEVNQFPLTDPEEASVDLLTAQGGQTQLIGGVLVSTATVPSVTIYPNGTCTAFRAQFRMRGGDVYTIDIDPWTCAPILEKGATP